MFSQLHIITVQNSLVLDDQHELQFDILKLLSRLKICSTFKFDQQIQREV